MVLPELQQKREILEMYRRRLYARELQLAQFGSMAEPSIKIDIEDIKKNIQNLEQQIEMLVGEEHGLYFLLGFYASALFALSRPNTKHSVSDLAESPIAQFKISKLLEILDLQQIKLNSDLWSEGDENFVRFLREIQVLLLNRSFRKNAAFQVGALGHIFSKNPDTFSAPFPLLETAQRAGFDTTLLSKEEVTNADFIHTLREKYQDLLEQTQP